MNDIDEVRLSINLLLDGLKKTCTEMESDYNRLQIALTGSLKLLDGTEAKTLTALHGNSADLKRYLISLVSDLKQNTINHLQGFTHHVQEILEQIEGIDRKH